MPAFLFWYLHHLRNLPDVINLPPARKNELASMANFVVMAAALVGNFVAAALARVMGYRRSIALLCLAYFLAMIATYSVPRTYQTLLVLLPVLGACGGLFALFTMYLPPLFPVLLRTTGAGFCYNIGRLAAAAGTVVFGLFSKVGDYRIALLSPAPSSCRRRFLPCGSPISLSSEWKWHWWASRSFPWRIEGPGRSGRARRGIPQRRQCNQRLGRGGLIQERIKPPGLNARVTPPFRTRADTSDRPQTRWVSALPDSRVRHLKNVVSARP